MVQALNERPSFFLNHTQLHSRGHLQLISRKARSQTSVDRRTVVSKAPQNSSNIPWLSAPCSPESTQQIPGWLHSLYTVQQVCGDTLGTATATAGRGVSPCHF
jgi:hypothetical protein